MADFMSDNFISAKDLTAQKERISKLESRVPDIDKNAKNITDLES